MTCARVPASSRLCRDAWIRLTPFWPSIPTARAVPGWHMQGKTSTQNCHRALPFRQSFGNSRKHVICNGEQIKPDGTRRHDRMGQPVRPCTAGSSGSQIW